MSERHKPHNGRDRSGHFKVKREDVDALRSDPAGDEFLQDDVRLGGAVEDIGADAGRHGERIESLIENNRQNVDKLSGADRSSSRRDQSRG